MKTIFALVLIALASFSTEARFPKLPVFTRFAKSAGTLIVGGRNARQGEAPYQLALTVRGSHYCGASLVELDGLQFGVTAAHCIGNPDATYYDITAGDLNNEDRSGIEQTINVAKIIVHENFDDWTLQNDIALLFINSSFTLNQNVSTVPLPSQGQNFTQGNLTVSGWGDLEYLGQSPADLQIVEIPLVNDTYCQEAYKDYFVKAVDSMICAGRPAGDISPCHGDSGGPAISDDGYLAGIVSWGHICGHPDYPAVFTEVAYFVDWIEAAVNRYKSPL